MEQPSYVRCRAGSSRLGLKVILTAMLLTAGILPAGAQTNTSVGSGALSKITSGTNNTALGFNTLFENMTGNGKHRYRGQRAGRQRR